jgi:hypothetical protein
MHGKLRPAEGADLGSFDRAFSSKLGRRIHPAAAVILVILWRSAQGLQVLVDSHGVDFARSLDVSIKSQLAGLFQGFEAVDTSGQLARRFKCGLSRLPGQVGVTRVLCWHGIFHRSLRMVTGTGYRRKLNRSFETSGNKKT